MKKRLIETRAGKGLYSCVDETTKTVWQEWLPLPQPSPIDSLRPLEAGPKVDLPGLYGPGLYGDHEQRRADERRRKADAVLEQHGIRPRRSVVSEERDETERVKLTQPVKPRYRRRRRREAERTDPLMQGGVIRRENVGQVLGVR